MEIKIKIPQLGENIVEATIVDILVKQGESVQKDQALLELETGKATVELPSPAEGKITNILVKAGDAVKVNQEIMVLSTDAGASKEAPEKTVEAAPQPVVTAAPVAGPVSAPEATPAAPKPPPPPSPPASPAPTPVLETDEEVERIAAPNARYLARELGVDISKIPSQSPDQRITIADVNTYATQLGVGKHETNVLVKPERMTTIRLRTAQHMARCAAEVPQVTQHIKAKLDAFERLRALFDKKKPDVKLTLTAFLMKALAELLVKYPKFNASVDMATESILYKTQINMGVAVDTERGLLVPVIHGINKKSLIQISHELTNLAAKARGGKLSMEEMSNGTFTITNIGGIGGSFFTPIVNTPEVGILGVGRAALEAVPIDKDNLKILPVLPLSLSYDHRLIDGADAARFMVDLVEIIEEPAILTFQ